jgi:hypothetical protein
MSILINKRFFLASFSVWFGLKWSPPAVVCSYCVRFFYRFSDTYAQPIGLYDMHPLSVKRRRFDTFQLLLPFNGPIKLFHSYPVDQSDATSIHFSFFFSPQGKCLSIIIGNMFFR